MKRSKRVVIMPIMMTTTALTSGYWQQGANIKGQTNEGVPAAARTQRKGKRSGARH